MTDTHERKGLIKVQYLIGENIRNNDSNTTTYTVQYVKQDFDFKSGERSHANPANTDCLLLFGLPIRFVTDLGQAGVPLTAADWFSVSTCQI